MAYLTTRNEVVYRKQIEGDTDGEIKKKIGNLMSLGSEPKVEDIFPDQFSGDGV